MKKKIYFIIGIFISISASAQKSYVQLYYNPELQAQVTANQGARMTSEELIRNKYEKVKEKYDKVNEKVAQILVIRQQLQSYLTNVHSLISNGKQLKNVYTDLDLLFENLIKLTSLSSKYPEYGIPIYKTYLEIYKRAINCQAYITDIILKEDPKYFIDQNTRQIFLTKVQLDIRYMNLLVYTIILHIENAKTLPYWRSINELNIWYMTDKAMIEQIILQANWL